MFYFFFQLKFLALVDNLLTFLKEFSREKHNLLFFLEDFSIIMLGNLTVLKAAVFFFTPIF